MELILFLFRLFGESIYNKYMYIDKRMIYIEVVISKAQGKPTKNLILMLDKIAKGIIKKRFYKRVEDREDAQSWALYKMMRYWRGFNEEKYDDPFAYYTEIGKRAMAESWNQMNVEEMFNIDDMVTL